ncbi:YkgJ family cysteine cluster protein [Foetidibacter luteolus]|uniref:YkgJ family cysteine cluster protein n=1 Tax=Foetidibacter luteolus TaxID=2608880 RepID=UPI00129BF9FA|nr:YkgJ family cysteine cluster protein [Foetidibacter luteolus]
MKAETSLAVISSAAITKEEENDAFREFLKVQDAGHVDTLVNVLNSQVEPLIDCTACGNCCRSLIINVEDKEADNLAAHLGLSRASFDEKYIEKSTGGIMAVNTIPCHFLSNNQCTVYEHRFADCRRFPNLHLPGFTNRLFASFMHYGRCPIVYNVIEYLKQEMNWQLP